MSDYTDYLEDSAERLDPTDELFVPKLREICTSFHGFGTALGEYLAERFAISSEPEVCIPFLEEKFKQNIGRKPRNMDRWFGPRGKIQRETAFQIVFALDLDVTQTDDFFRRVYLDRSFNCHDIREAVYYFCRMQNLSYAHAQDLICCVMQKAEEAERKAPSSERLYTQSIRNEISAMTGEDQLVTYLSENYADFAYSQVTAQDKIRELWNDITKEDGLAMWESKYLSYVSSLHSSKTADSTDAEDAARFRDETPAVKTESDSVWSTLAQIFGLDQKEMKGFGRNRSIKPILVGSSILNTMAESDFPDRDGIQKVLHRRPMEHDRVRKILVLLSFYRFWAARLYDESGAKSDAAAKDAADCFYTMNSLLLEAGFQELYLGNPYDWIFLWCMNDEEPLDTFRYYLGEVFATHIEETSGADVELPSDLQ